MGQEGLGLENWSLRDCNWGLHGNECNHQILWPPDVKSWLIWKRHWCWERLKVRQEGDDRGWDGWMASPTQRIWVWEKSRNWRWTGRPGMLQSMGLWRVGQFNRVTKLNHQKPHCAVPLFDKLLNQKAYWFLSLLFIPSSCSIPNHS